MRDFIEECDTDNPDFECPSPIFDGFPFRDLDRKHWSRIALWREYRRVTAEREERRLAAAPAVVAAVMHNTAGPDANIRARKRAAEDDAYFEALDDERADADGEDAAHGEHSRAAGKRARTRRHVSPESSEDDDTPV